MSRTNRENEGRQSVGIAGYLSFHGKTGVIKKRSIDGKKSEIPVGGFGCILLNDQHFKVGGGSNTFYFYSQVQKQGGEVTVWRKNFPDAPKIPTEKVAQGTWKQIKELLGQANAKYVKVIYVLHNGETWALELKGGALMSYGEFTKSLGKGRYDGVMTYQSTTSKVNGAVSYVVPNWELIPAEKYNKSIFLAADKADKVLTQELKAMLGASEDEFTPPSVSMETAADQAPPMVEMEPIEVKTEPTPEVEQEDLPF